MWNRACEEMLAWRLMSDTLKTLIESLVMIGVISAGFVWHAVVTARREDRNAQLSQRAIRHTVHGNGLDRRGMKEDPDAHLGRSGAE